MIYGIEAYFNTAKRYTNRLVVLQKKAIRFVNALEFNAHTEGYFKSNRILKLEDLHRQFTSVYLFKTLNYDHDPILLSELIRRNRFHIHDTRDNQKLSIPHFSLSKSQQSISYVGVKVWNSLPDSVVDSRSVAGFKNNMKESIIGSY